MISYLFSKLGYNEMYQSNKKEEYIKYDKRIVFTEFDIGGIVDIQVWDRITKKYPCELTKAEASVCVLRIITWRFSHR